MRVIRRYFIPNAAFFAWAFMVFIMTTLVALAQTTQSLDNPFPYSSVVIGLASLLGPIIIWVIKKLPWQNVPSWATPLLVTGLGFASTQVAAWSQNAALAWYISLALGLASIGLREVIDQLKKRLVGA